MASHYFYNQTGMSYLESTLSQRHWSIKYFYSGKHHYPLVIRLWSAVLTVLTWMAPLVKFVLWMIDTPLLLKRNWRRAVDLVSALSLAIVLLTYSMQ